jgi:mannan endo-1,4-beta-mannosidase
MSTAQNLLAYLKSIAGNHCISGQFVETGPGMSAINAIQASTGKWLGLIGGDYWHYGGTGAPVAGYPFNVAAIPYWQAGGLITLCLSMPNPSTGGPSTDVSALDADDLLIPGTPTNTALLGTLDAIGAGLAQLQAAGVVVILRPFWEMNGNWFWWGTKFLSAAQFISLWQYVRNYLTLNKGLTNLLWLYSVNAGTGSLTATFPGLAYADLTGFDIYSSNPADGVASYATLESIGLPVCISEFGAGSPNAGDANFNETALITAIQTSMPNVIFFQQWWDGNAANVGWGMAEVQAAPAALADGFVLNRGDFTIPNPAAALIASLQAQISQAAAILSAVHTTLAGLVP